MGAATGIQWCDHTFNPWWGCAKVSPACDHCYAETFAKRLGLKVWGQSKDRRFFGDKHWNEPLKWNQAAREAGVRRRVFCASMADVFEDRRDLDAHRDRLWKLIEATPMLDWLLLTKRPENHDMVPIAWQTGSRRPRNVWLGATVEDRARARERVPHLLAAKWPAVRFLSMEPLLEDLDQVPAGVDWVIVGGESGPRSRIFDAAYARFVVEQCRERGIPVFVKQLGTVAVDSDWGGLMPLNLTGKGGDPAEWPEDLRVREFPRTEAR